MQLSGAHVTNLHAELEFLKLQLLSTTELAASHNPAQPSDLVSGDATPSAEGYPSADGAPAASSSISAGMQKCLSFGDLAGSSNGGTVVPAAPAAATSQPADPCFEPDFAVEAAGAAGASAGASTGSAAGGVGAGIAPGAGAAAVICPGAFVWARESAVGDCACKCLGEGALCASQPIIAHHLADHGQCFQSGPFMMGVNSFLNSPLSPCFLPNKCRQDRRQLLTRFM